ncbi:MAG: class I adenylate-forming enzyme family protein [Solirubrobacteraceae bacterium]
MCNGPIHHLSGLAELPGTALAAGGTSVFMERFDPGEELALIERERINGMIQIPTQYQLMAANPDFERADLSSLRRVVWAGAAMPRSVIAAWRERTDAQLEVQYGSTETTLTVTYSDPDADLEQLAESIGKPDPDIELRLADTTGAPSAQGEPGEIQVRHPGVFGGYLGRPHATREAFTSDGFLRTGDLAVERPDGSLRLVGRRSEMYKSGGSNVYPREIELCLERHPAVAIAAVVSVPDPLYSEVGHAFVAQFIRQLRAPDPSVTFHWLVRHRFAEPTQRHEDGRTVQRPVILDERPDHFPCGLVDRIAFLVVDVQAVPAELPPRTQARHDADQRIRVGSLLAEL